MLITDADTLWALHSAIEVEAHVAPSSSAKAKRRTHTIPISTISLPGRVTGLTYARRSKSVNQLDERDLSRDATARAIAHASNFSSPIDRWLFTWKTLVIVDWDCHPGPRDAPFGLSD